MTSERSARGTECESLAAQFLEARGVKILARNLRCKSGELDLVCRDGGVLAIVEVRQRRGDDFGGALASVNASKQRKLIGAARYFLASHVLPRACRMRFDVVAVQGMPHGTHQIQWIKDAFRVSS